MLYYLIVKYLKYEVQLQELLFCGMRFSMKFSAHRYGTVEESRQLIVVFYLGPISIALFFHDLTTTFSLDGVFIYLIVSFMHFYRILVM